MSWTIFDYGVGNLHSLQRALARAGAETVVTTQAADLADATVAVLPGVGAFGAVMEVLAPATDVLRQRHRDGRPILAVCIGMQVLYEGSDEAPVNAGLALFEGRARRLAGRRVKVPHMGWNTVQQAPDEVWEGVPDGGHFYFVHSYYVTPDSMTTATTVHGEQLSAAIRSGETVGFQFHPEKSGHNGAVVLRNLVAKWGAA